jgi:hypothetical protein
MGQQALFPELEPQGDLFGGADLVKKPRVVDPNRVRPRLYNFIAELEAADTMPWGPGNLRLRKEIIPRMINYLPEAERPALLEAFERQIERLNPVAK